MNIRDNKVTENCHLRIHKDFISELDYVCELDGQVIANVMYTKSKLVDEKGNTIQILTFGSMSVSPEFHCNGIGKALLEKSFDKAIKMGYKAIVIFGNPDNYVARGFRRYNVCLEKDIFPAALLVKELERNFFDGRRYYFYESSAFEINDEEMQIEYRDIREYIEVLKILRQYKI